MHVLFSLQPRCCQSQLWLMTMVWWLCRQLLLCLILPSVTVVVNFAISYSHGSWTWSSDYAVSHCCGWFCHQLQLWFMAVVWWLCCQLQLCSWPLSSDLSSVTVVVHGHGLLTLVSDTTVINGCCLVTLLSVTVVIHGQCLVSLLSVTVAIYSHCLVTLLLVTVVIHGHGLTTLPLVTIAIHGHCLVTLPLVTIVIHGRCLGTLLSITIVIHGSGLWRIFLVVTHHRCQYLLGVYLALHKCNSKDQAGLKCEKVACKSCRRS